MTTKEQLSADIKYLNELLQNGESERLESYLESLPTSEIKFLLSHIGKQERSRMMSLLSAKAAADLLEEISEEEGVILVEELPKQTVASIISEMDSDEQVDLLTELESEEAEAILEEMEPEVAEEVKAMMDYNPLSAGGLMITEFLSFPMKMIINEVIRELSEGAEKYIDYNVQYIYVHDENHFKGVLRLHDLLFSDPKITLEKILITPAITTTVDTPLTELIKLFEQYDFYGIPVLDELNRQVGIVLRKDIQEARVEVLSLEHLESQGIVGGDELRTMPIFTRSKRRLSWLGINIGLNVMAASIIAFYQDTLSSLIALAVFLPVISDMSGCSGNQAIAVSMRELSLGVIKPFEVLRVFLQEVWIGLINGIFLGIFIGCVAWLWKGSSLLGLVIGGALALNTILAVSLGGTIPLVLKRLNYDPALASGPILTTVTDMMGFFLTLSFATMMLK